VKGERVAKRSSPTRRGAFPRRYLTNSFALAASAFDRALPSEPPATAAFSYHIVHLPSYADSSHPLADRISRRDIFGGGHRIALNHGECENAVSHAREADMDPAWRVWCRTQGETRTRLAWLYAAQLVLNALWSVLFFGLRQPGLALVEIALLWLVLVITLVRYWKIDRVAGALWTPYVLWVSFASALNAALWHLNR
jgi:hypothetical protein